MARAATTDLFEANEFHVVDPGNFLQVQAGFNAATLPTKTLSTAEYKTGLDKLPRKQRGVGTVGEVVLSRGVARAGTDFLDWLNAALNGEEYRTDLEIWHFHGTDSKGPEGNPSRVIRILEAIPGNVVLGSDFDPNSEAVSIESITIQCEDVEIYLRAPAA